MTDSSSVATTSYPARLTGTLDAPSRALWLVKWILVIPHLIVLFFLYIALFFVGIIAFFAILFTGNYPRALFDFAVGVLRWSWRVAFYAYSALGTDKYPPFTLQKTDYPADFEVDYPQSLSRGLIFVKWWLLILPHALIVGVLSGGTFMAMGWRADGAHPPYDGQHDLGMGNGGMWNDGMWSNPSWSGGMGADGSHGGFGLIGLLVLIAAIALLFRGTHIRSLFDLIVGLNRWVFRVTAYTFLLTDVYPPFRLDQGEVEPGAIQVASAKP
jgi:hypothetical protein